jgi:hypothetical protein
LRLPAQSGALNTFACGESRAENAVGASAFSKRASALLGGVCRALKTKRKQQAVPIWSAVCVSKNL